MVHFSLGVLFYPRSLPTPSRSHFSPSASCIHRSPLFMVFDRPIQHECSHQAKHSIPSFLWAELNGVSARHCEKLFDFYGSLLRKFFTSLDGSGCTFCSPWKWTMCEKKMQVNEWRNEQLVFLSRYYKSYIPGNYGLIINEIDPIKFRKNDLNIMK